MSLSRDINLAEAQVTLREALRLLGLLAVLASVQCSQDRPSWRYISSELVIPRKEPHHGKGVQMPGWLSYSLRFGGQRHVVHMRPKKIFWPGHLLLMTQDDQGALQTDHPFIPSDCYYLGYLEEVPFSRVTVDTCYGGLRGFIKLDDLTYEINPLKESQKFEHVISQIVADASAVGPMYTLGYKEEENPVFSLEDASAAPRLSSKSFSSHRANFKGFLHCTHAMHSSLGNLSDSITYLIDIGSIMDSMLLTLDSKYYISILLVYNTRDPVNTQNLGEGSPYYQYYQQTLYPRFSPHTATLVNRHHPGDNQYQVRLHTICTNRNLLVVGHLGRNKIMVAGVASAHTGRSIGLFYDEMSCVCQRRSVCLMFCTPGLTDTFSNCSFMHVQNVYFYARIDCMFQTGFVYHNSSLTNARCGDKNVDTGETCDCGSFKECYSNPCCTDECQLTPGSSCSVDLCCSNCNYSHSGTLCRPTQNICDLPEYCSGTERFCPDDFYLQDGTPCSEEGYCYHGNCTDRSMHCKEIFGRNAVNAAIECYSINKRGNRFGHCRKLPTKTYFGACRDPDVLCGRLQCTNVTHLPALQEHVGFHQSVISRKLCFGVDLHRGTETNDVGYVRPGTLCRPQVFCSNTYCNGTLNDLSYDCIPEKCGYRGICNNRRNCHCHRGWDPPDCTQVGIGGSVDSGPPPKLRGSLKQSQAPIVYLKLLFGCIYAFITVILLTSVQPQAM
uniref:Disintegrin and metalloproteinase domain-containing protein 21-like n=1 Tax=Catagonus wagneri TaxID=51154 RepID=A0A8C3WZ88_9CETA